MAQRTFQGAGQGPGTVKWLVCTFDVLKQEPEQLALFDAGARPPGTGPLRVLLVPVGARGDILFCTLPRSPWPPWSCARAAHAGSPGRAAAGRASCRARALTGPGVQINLAAARRAGGAYVLLHTLPRGDTLAHCVFFWVGEAAAQARRPHAMRRPAARCPPTLRADRISCLAHQQPLARRAARDGDGRG